MTLKYALTHPHATPPRRKHPADAGVDVFARETVTIPPFSAGRVPTGVTFDIPPQYMLLAKPKSGSDFLLGAGVIDPGYQGEVLIKVVNYTAEAITIEQGQPVAQLVQVAIFTDPLEELPLEDIHAQKSERGADGGIVRQ